MSPSISFAERFDDFLSSGRIEGCSPEIIEELVEELISNALLEEHTDTVRSPVTSFAADNRTVSAAEQVRTQYVILRARQMP
jgi:hypothetical protein